jgi:hypothetical protein
MKSSVISASVSLLSRKEIRTQSQSNSSTEISSRHNNNESYQDRSSLLIQPINRAIHLHSKLVSSKLEHFKLILDLRSSRNEALPSAPKGEMAAFAEQNSLNTMTHASSESSLQIFEDKD